MMNMTKRNPKKLISKILSIAFAGVVLCAGVFPFLPMQEDKASAEGVSTSTDDVFSSENYTHNPFANAVVYRRTSKGMFSNTLPKDLSLPSSPSSNSALTEYSRGSYKATYYTDGSTSDTGKFLFYDTIQENGNNYFYQSDCQSQSPVSARYGDLLWSFSFENILLTKTELESFVLNHRSFYGATAGNWITEKCGTHIVWDYLESAQFWSTGYNYIPATLKEWTDSDAFEWGYKYPFNHVSNLHTISVSYTDTDGVEYTRDFYMLRGRISIYSNVNGLQYFTMVNTAIRSPLLTYKEWANNDFDKYYKQVFNPNGLYSRIDQLETKNEILETEKGILNNRVSELETLIDGKVNPTDVIFGVVQNFLDLEIFPNFKLSYFISVLIGTVLFGFIVKFFLGG